MKKHKLSLGARSADRITRVVGSWKFIIIQTALLIIWMILNITAWTNHWDPYPFILLNLALSFQAAYTAPIILMSENREMERERRKNALDLATDKKSEKGITEIQKKLNRLEKDKLDQILKILNEK